MNNEITNEDVQNAIEKETEKLQLAYSQEHKDVLGSSWMACTGCKTGLTASVAGLIAAAIAGFPEDVPEVGAIAAAAGLQEEVVIAILAGGASTVESVIEKLCEKMGAC